MQRVSAIVPCYNEEENVIPFYESISKVFKELSEYELEIVYVNDGSSDNTLENLRKIVNVAECGIKVVSFSRNFGKESAMYAGFKNCTGDMAVVIDADLQQDPVLIKDMLNILKNDPDCDSVAYFQKNRSESALLKFFKKGFYSLINRMSEVEFVNGASDFRIFRRNMIESILMLSEKNRFSKGIFSWVGFNTKYLPYEAKERTHGKSKWNFFKLLKYAISGIVSFSTAPLKIATYLGTFFSFASVVYLIIIVLQYILNDIAIPGYATIVCLILLLGGIQLFCIGIIGEYLEKTYIETKSRPVYIVKNIYTNEK